MAAVIKAAIQRCLSARGLEIVRTNFSPREKAAMDKVRRFTATGSWRMAGLLDAVAHIVSNRIAGAVVECGVWRGGSSMLAANALLDAGDTSRDIFLFDTFSGMSPPTDRDVLFDGTKAASLLQAERCERLDNYWCVGSESAVRRNMRSTGYPESRIRLVKGRVEETLPAFAPERIALLRLDTDFYESTKHELEHLYPRLAPSGVLIIDDYGHWLGARQAVDDYLATLPVKPLLSRLDYTGRMAVKP